MTLQGVRNSRDTILWRLEASVFELQTVLDERAATQRALVEFERAAEEDAAATESGARVVVPARAKTTRTRKVTKRKLLMNSTSSRARVPPP